MLRILNLVLLNSLFALAISFATGFDAFTCVGVANAASFIPRAANYSLMAGLNHEIWIETIKEGYYPKGSFISQSTDMSVFVKYNTINLAEAGADPNVIINNNVFPVPFAKRTDAPIALPLDVHDTEGTWVENTEEVETSYDKMASVTRGHKNSLFATEVKRAAHNWAPAANSVLTPVFGTTGAGFNGKKRLIFEDIIRLQKEFNLIDAPDEGRILVLNPQHLEDLSVQDMNLYKAIMAQEGGSLYGFKVYTTSQTPKYNATTGAKKAYGAAPAGTDTFASFAYLASEVMRCEGEMKMFEELNSPKYKGDIINFQKRFLALPIRAKGLSAIYSANV